WGGGRIRRRDFPARRLSAPADRHEDDAPTHRSTIRPVPPPSQARFSRGRTEPAPMRALLQRVERAAVYVDERTVGQIGVGLLVLLGVTHHDDRADAITLAAKVHTLRILRD